MFSSQDVYDTFFASQVFIIFLHCLCPGSTRDSTVLEKMSNEEKADMLKSYNKVSICFKFYLFFMLLRRKLGIRCDICIAILPRNFSTFRVLGNKWFQPISFSLLLCTFSPMRAFYLKCIQLVT